MVVSLAGTALGGDRTHPLHREAASRGGTSIDSTAADSTGGGHLRDRPAAGGAHLGGALPHHAARRLPRRSGVPGLPGRVRLRRRLVPLRAARPPVARRWGALRPRSGVHEGTVPPPLRPPFSPRRRPHEHVAGQGDRRQVLHAVSEGAAHLVGPHCALLGLDSSPRLLQVGSSTMHLSWIF